MENNLTWLNELQKQGSKVYSQGNQDGFLQYIFQNIGTTNKVAVEFGFNSNQLIGGPVTSTEGSGANVALLVTKDGWKPILFDGGHENPEINLHKVFLTPDNIADTFREHNVPTEPDYVSIDVDSIDLWLFESMVEGGFRPRVVSIEYNANFSIDTAVTNKKNAIWRGDGSFGSSLKALYLSGISKGYNMVCVETTLDVFLIRNDIVPHIFSLENFAAYCGHSSHSVPTRESLEWVIQYPSLEPLQMHQVPWPSLKAFYPNLKGEETFTPEEWTTIAALQQRYAEQSFRFSQLYLELDSAKKELQTIRKEEQDLIFAFQKKYGDGQLNLATGVFTRKSQE